MTYIDYLNRFNQWNESNDLPLYAVVLYYRLLDRFNRAGWPRNLRVDTLRLMLMAGCQKDAAYRARDKLAEAGFIRYEKGSKGKPTVYFLSDILSFKTTETPTETPTERATVIAPQRERPKTKKKNIYPPIPQGGPMPDTSPEATGFGPQLQDAFENWLGYKRERREGYKPQGLKSLITQLRGAAESYGETAVIRRIEDSMANGYKGILLEKLTRGGHPAEDLSPKSYDSLELDSLGRFDLPDGF